MQILSLRYKDTSYAMNIILPKKRFGLDALRKKLNGAGIQKVLSQLSRTYVTISIPKMKIETDFKLKKALIAMGITEMFSDSADLTGIARDPPLKVSDAAHKAIIEVSVRLVSHNGSVRKDHNVLLSFLICYVRVNIGGFLVGND
ncbi:hypothetical protein ANCDUO_26139 [Ancylostoma duodenale]|uniref:Serpin domain-containing protein n=1 Tax=Ancylostoma duodenale TaxID=51022 RepID=A0A0C2FAN2_9BILA|nr:hypothetical protein ANCDUO_26139 [Ancylostoma duodenale]